MKTVITIMAIVAINTLLAAEYSPMPESVRIGKHPKADVPFDLDELKSIWRKRIVAIKQDGKLPIIDIESSFNPGAVNALSYAQAMDKNGIALTAFSAQIGKRKYNNKGVLWHDGARRAVGIDPVRYIPTSTAGIYPAFTNEPLAFIEETINRVEKDNYPLMGEFEFRHYMSPRQYKRGEHYRDVSIPIDSDAGHRLFDFANRSSIPFQIHYEIEDELLPPLEMMLSRYNKARVIWCHLGQVRYAARSRRYGPAYVSSLIEKHPHIYFDLAFAGADSIYPGSNERHSRVWDSNGRVKDEWIKLITAHPYRFLAALDIGGDRLHHVASKTHNLRHFIGSLPTETQEIVAYKAAWKLIFNEEF